MHSIVTARCKGRPKFRKWNDDWRKKLRFTVGHDTMSLGPGWAKGLRQQGKRIKVEKHTRCGCKYG